MAPVEKFLTTLKEEERVAALNSLQEYFPDIFSGAPNSIRTAFVESPFIKTMFKGSGQVEPLVLYLASNSLNDRIFLRFSKKAENQFDWKLEYLIENERLDQEVTCIWNGDSFGTYGNLEINFKDTESSQKVIFDPKQNDLAIGTGEK